MKSSKNDIIDSTLFKVKPSGATQKDYFLINLPQIGYVDFLDFELEKKGRSKVSISFVLTGTGQALSIPNAPFGGFWCEKGVNSDTLEDFILDLQIELKRLGVNYLKLTQAPKSYEPLSDLINNLLFKLGFQQTAVLSHHFFSGGKKIRKSLKEEEPKIRKKLKTAQLTASHGNIESFDFLKQIKQWNSLKGYEENLDETQLIDQVSEYPERYFLIKLESFDKPVGLALAVKLTSYSIYYFLSALDSTTSIKNGGDFLLHELFLLAREQKVDFIDLGSSETKSRVNHSLMFFKSKFANDISNKITWEKHL